jgi:DnaK suppressor protein
MKKMSSEKERLERELKETLAEIEQLNKKLEDKADYSLGEGGSTIYEWEFNLALRRSLEEKAKSIEAALRKMEGGRYGICEICGKEINAERLKVLPHTTLCIECARAMR